MIADDAMVLMCGVLQVRSSKLVAACARRCGRRTGGAAWGFTDPQLIGQCAKEGFVEKLLAQDGEGCHLWGTLAVNKVPAPTCILHIEPYFCIQRVPAQFADRENAQEAAACMAYVLSGCCHAQVAGNFHFAPGKSFQQGAVHVHDLVPFQR